MTSIYQLKIEVSGSQPSIWRRLQVAGDLLFSELHDMIQITFQAELEFEEYEFFINNIRIYDFGAEIDSGKNPELKDSNETFLKEYLKLTGTKFLYTCESDELSPCSIVLEEILQESENIENPRCVDGEGIIPVSDSQSFEKEEINRWLQEYVEAWGEIYEETEKFFGDNINEDEEDEDEFWSEEDEPEFNDHYESVKHLKNPEDLLKDELEKEDMQHWLEDNLYNEESLEYKTYQRLLDNGYRESEAKNLLLECLAIKWFSDLKYGTGFLVERYQYNLNQLPAKPLEIPTLDFAIQVLENADKGIPFPAIEYLHDHNSPEATNAIVNALNNYSNHQYCWGNCLYAPIWYAMATEGHLHEVMIDPVINLCKNNDNETDWLLEQAEFLIGKLAMKYPELTAAKVLDALEKDAVEKTDHNLFFLLDCFYFCDISLHKERLLSLIQYTDACWHDSLIGTLSFLQVKEALPILQQQLVELQKSNPEKNYIEHKEAIEELEAGEVKYPEVNMPLCLKRNNTLREEYEPIEEGFYPDHSPDFYDAFESAEMPWEKEEPVVVGPKIGRNDPCPCGSGKKYKKCCMS